MVHPLHNFFFFYQLKHKVEHQLQFHRRFIVVSLSSSFFLAFFARHNYSPIQYTSRKDRANAVSSFFSGLFLVLATFNVIFIQCWSNKIINKSPAYADKHMIHDILDILVLCSPRSTRRPIYCRTRHSKNNRKFFYFPGTVSISKNYDAKYVLWYFNLKLDPIFLP